MGCFLIFDFPSAVIPLAADLTMLARTWQRCGWQFAAARFWSGVLAGIAFLINSKALFVLAACALWCFPQIVPLALDLLCRTPSRQRGWRRAAHSCRTSTRSGAGVFFMPEVLFSNIRCGLARRATGEWLDFTLRS